MDTFSISFLRTLLNYGIWFISLAPGYWIMAILGDQLESSYIRYYISDLYISVMVSNLDRETQVRNFRKPDF